jgi:predicted small secreted protein
VIRKTVAAIAGIVLAGAALTGCATRNVDIDAAGATPVPGAHGLYRMCDMSTLIYFTSISGASDEYDAYFSYHCVYDSASKTWIMNTDPGVPADYEQSQQESEMNQQQERTTE